LKRSGWQNGRLKLALRRWQAGMVHSSKGSTRASRAGWSRMPRLAMFSKAASVPVDGDDAPAPGEDLLGVAALAAAQVDGEGDAGVGGCDPVGIGDALGGEARRAASVVSRGPLPSMTAK
jgi:hypothetical protein